MPFARHDLAVRMADLAREIALPLPVERVLADVTAAAIELIPGADAAAVLLTGGSSGRGGTTSFETLAPTSPLARRLDELQIQHGQGPCVEAAQHGTVVRTDDFAEEGRWPRYSPDVVRLGVRSGLCFRLYTAARTAGALNLFSKRARVWDHEAETVGMVLAAHAAAAILAGREGEQLQSALSSRDQIGQAKGIIMERYGIDDVRAFEMLRRLSQDTNTKLVEVAQRVITGRGQA